MEEPLEKIVRSAPDGFSDFSEAEKRKVKELNETWKEAIGKVDKSAKVFRKAADKIDKVWKDCKIAHAYGTSAAIMGGIFTIFGGIATIMTAGAATPLMLAGIGFGTAGAATNVGTSIVEACINSSEIKEADECLKTTLACMEKLGQKALAILNQKDMGRSVNIFGLAVYTLELSKSIIKIFQDLAPHVLNIRAGFMQVASGSAKHLGKESADDAAGAVAKAAAKRAGGVIIGISAFFLALDLIDLGVTIRDLVKNEGLEATKTLRHIADQLEKEAFRLKC